MKALDTNVLVRFLTGDDPVQTRQARTIIEDAQAQGEPLFLSLVMLCECVWVLSRFHKRSRTEIAAALEEVMGAGGVVIEQAALAWHSLDRFRQGRGDFADYVIGAVAEQAGCDTTYTFDRGLRGEAGFQVL